MRFRLAALLPLLCPLFFSCLAPAETQAASGPTYTTALPKNLDLGDVSEEDVRSYYSSLEGKALQGEDLLIALHPLLQDFRYYSYDNVWKIYEITDREWELSPKEEITQGTYDEATDTVSSYVYGSGNGNPGPDNPYVHTLYRNRDQNGITVEEGRIREWGDHSQTGGTNREHVWCQSRGFKAPTGANGPAGTDVHHLISGDGYVNGVPHNDNPYGFVDKDHIAVDAANKYAYCEGNYLGAPLHPSEADLSSAVFEPQDSDKGDIARACFYMVACYNNLSGEGAVTQYNPDLALCDYATSAEKSEISSEVGHAVGMGILRDLLAWHRLDPVDDYEIHRNNLIYSNFQGNRNPFVDFPDWVEAIWGRAELDMATLDVAYDPTPFGVADPANDDVRLNGETWYTSLSVEGAKTRFDEGEDFLFLGKVYAHDEDGRSVDVTDRCVFSGYDSTPGEKTVTVTHLSGISTTYAVEVGGEPSSSEVPSSHSSSSRVPTVYENDYVYVSDVGELREGDEILLVGHKSDYAALSVVQNGNNRGQVTLSNCSPSHLNAPEEGACTLRLSKVENTAYWSLYDPVGGGYLYAASSSANYLRTQKQLNENGYWSLSVDSSGWSLLAQGSSSHNDLRYNPTSGIFACYASNTTQAKPLLYKSYAHEADAYGQAFLDAYTAGCDEHGLSSTLDWPGAKQAFLDLSGGTKTLLSSLPCIGMEPRFLCLARYDYIVHKYGKATYEDYIGREGATLYKGALSPSSRDASFPYWIMIVASISGLCLFALARKRKRA